MKKIFLTLAILLVPTLACAGTVTLTITPSTNDNLVTYYAVEENGVELTQTCTPGCMTIQIMNRADGEYVYRVGAVQEYVLGTDPTILRHINWSAPFNLIVACEVPDDIDPADIVGGEVTCP